MGISRKLQALATRLKLLVPDQDGRYRHQDPRHRLPRPGVRLHTVLVDWQSLRLSLARGRRQAGPAWVLQALVEEVGRVLADPARRAGTTVWLFLSPASELRRTACCSVGSRRRPFRRGPGPLPATAT